MKLHLRLLLKELRAVQRDRREWYGAERLRGLLVVQRHKTGHGFHEWVLRYAGREPFPRNCLSRRDTVWVRRGTTWPTAVIRRITDRALTLVMDKNKKLTLHQYVGVYQLNDDVIYERMRTALDELLSLCSGPAGCLAATLFAETACPLEPPAAQLPPQLLDDDGKLMLFNESLDPSQREAVEFALRQRRLAVIHGPAGTGKTTTAVEVILQHVERGQRVLVCAPSNVAVDNLLEKLHYAELRNMVRLGHPARIEDRQLIVERPADCLLDCLLEEREEDHLLNYWIDERAYRLLENWEDRLGEDWDDEPGEKELKRKIIEEAEVVLCTLATASKQGPLKLTEHGGTFDLLVIDECSQAKEAECWLAIPRVRKLVLFGDPQQLSPMVRSEAAKEQGLAISLMERQMELHGDAVVRRLGTQYRMHELIQEWSSGQHYGGLLTPAPTVQRHRLSQLRGVSDTEDTGPILLMVDTSGCGLTESAESERRTGSLRNIGEADIAATHAAALVGDGVRQDDIGVITTYKAQTTAIRTALLRHRLKDVEVSTVDGFQGREKEAIVLSLVRSNDKGKVGFLGDRRRINVAVTRARRQLCVVCDADTVSVDDGLASLVDNLRKNGEVRPARAYVLHLSPEALRQFKGSKK